MGQASAVSRSSALAQANSNLQMDQSGPDVRSDSELRFAPQVITSVREYCDYEPPNFLLMSPDTPLYDPVNFRLDNNGNVIRGENTQGNKDGNKSDKSSTSTQEQTNSDNNNKDLLRQKVRLDSLSISKYHLNGYITCASLSMDQNCYVRVSSDGWSTFQIGGLKRQIIFWNF